MRWPNFAPKCFAYGSFFLVGVVTEGSEEFNQDVSGEWPVSIEKVTVELTFTDRFPKDAGISADSGTGGCNANCVNGGATHITCRRQPLV